LLVVAPKNNNKEKIKAVISKQKTFQKTPPSIFVDVINHKIKNLWLSRCALTFLNTIAEKLCKTYLLIKPSPTLWKNRWHFLLVQCSGGLWQLVAKCFIWGHDTTDFEPKNSQTYVHCLSKILIKIRLSNRFRFFLDSEFSFLLSS
jgi:hypothetical protein